ncbi:VWA domain-containing protein [Vibrio pomeroyi]|uniref:VWA domain-containing protein n=1 Tax=Vibrio pomeroyi TaxID=198832 RepID=A0ABV4MR21_9VIBR|nr:vWA domain-containing protein [Vibrio atlanticus]MCZ4311404.1 VWA domain-containing protein [Vibrio atlanticus]
MKGTKFTCSLIATLLLTACGQEQAPKNTSQKVSPVPAIMDSTPPALYGMRGADRSWPGEPDNSLDLADNNSTRNYYVVFDGSGSMNDDQCGDGRSRIDAAKGSIKKFFNAIPADSNVGLFVFDNNGSREVSPLKAVNVGSLTKMIDQVRAGDGTPLGYSLAVAYKSLLEQGQKQQGYGDYNIVVVTDGAAGDQKLMEDSVSYITTNSPVSIHTIGFCLGNGHTLNQQGVVNYKSATNSAELVSGLQSVLAEAESFDTSSFTGMANE